MLHQSPGFSQPLHPTCWVSAAYVGSVPRRAEGSPTGQLDCYVLFHYAFAHIGSLSRGSQTSSPSFVVGSFRFIQGVGSVQVCGRRCCELARRALHVYTAYRVKEMPRCSEIVLRYTQDTQGLCQDTPAFYSLTATQGIMCYT
jgi:hypothetical protein